LANKGDQQGAESHFLASIERLTKAAKQFPSHVRVQVEFAACHNNFAQFLATVNQVERSEKHFALAEEKLARALDEFNEYPSVVEFLCGVQHNQGLLFEQSHQPEKARSAYHRALQSTKGKTVSMPTQQIIKSVSIALERMGANEKVDATLGSHPTSSSSDLPVPDNPSLDGTQQGLPASSRPVADESGQIIPAGNEEALQ
jgi:hypothetical protein